MSDCASGIEARKLNSPGSPSASPSSVWRWLPWLICGLSMVETVESAELFFFWYGDIT